MFVSKLFILFWYLYHLRQIILCRVAYENTIHQQAFGLSIVQRKRKACMLKWFLIWSLYLILPASADCCSKRYCKDMVTCAEAYHYMTMCGLSRLDRDQDGIPCEKVC
ncbi:MAG: excalibur calcium-binding domain-containing protein, partial [Pseudomonadota bacterium]